MSSAVELIYRTNSAKLPVINAGNLADEIIT